jgi:hydrogenase large subunit
MPTEVSTQTTATPITVIDPISRLEGHLRLEVQIEGGTVKDARASGTLFRGFENILIGRDPRDSQHITQRICGVCPVSHSMAAVIALDAACGVAVNNNARILRNLVMGANHLDSHILHFYHLTLPDFVEMPNMAPWDTSMNSLKKITGTAAEVWVAHYLEALKYRRQAHEMAAIFGGKLPHPPTYVPGGFTNTPTGDQISRFGAYLNNVITFINNYYLPDAKALGQVYPEYSSIGRGYGNLLSFGCFDLDTSGSSKLLARGRVTNGSTTVQPVDVQAITEHVNYSWYSNRTAVINLDDAFTVINGGNLNPAHGVTEPVDPAAKPNAYSWLKAPRYANEPYEAGPLARMFVTGPYLDWQPAGISVMDRHLARAYETLKVAQAMQTWLTQLQGGQTAYTPCSVPNSATAFGLTEAPRGALGHWLQITNGKLSRYQVVTPTCWNASPRDARGLPGPIEKALIGTPVQDATRPIEVLRVVHSFDPCLACAVHVMRPGAGKTVFAIPHVHGGDEVHTHAHQAQCHHPGSDYHRDHDH